VEAGVEALNRENKVDYTFRIIAADGTVKWLRSIANVIKDKDGKPSTVMGIEQDVTERQKLVAKLEESQRLYKQAQELAKMGNFSWNLQNGHVFWSDEVYKIYERPVGEKVSFDDAFAPIIEEHKETVQQAIQEVIAGKKGRSISYAIRKRDGGLKYILLHTDVQFDSQGEVCQVIGTAQDTTDKELLIEQLQKSERLYKQARKRCSGSTVAKETIHSQKKNGFLIWISKPRSGWSNSLPLPSPGWRLLI
jgi:PAS domain-containing protein